MEEFTAQRRWPIPLVIAVSTLAAAALLLFAGRAQAANGSCEAVGAGFHCYYSEGTVSPYQNVWFDSGGENLRRWETNEARDSYASHIAKCAGLKRYDGTYFPETSCGNAAGQGIFLNASWRPGWVYMFQYASGARVVNGNAWQE